MRVFIILGFLVAASTAAGLGYNYGQGFGGISGNSYGSGLISSTGGLIGTGHSGLISTSGYGGQRMSAGGLINSGLIGISGGGYNTGGSHLISGGGYNTGGSQLISGGGYNTGGRQIISGGGYNTGGSQLISGGGYNTGGRQIISGGGYNTGGSQIISGGGYNTGRSNLLEIPSLDSIPQTVEYSKQFYHFEAPEEVHQDGQITKQLSNVLKKNLQVVFIKAPENNAATNAAIQLARQAIEQRTAIYVLSKQNDGAQLVGQLQQIQENVQTAPEVRIVKYRTPQDLAYAKEIIQAQYENGGGSTESFNGGVAPVLNYASPGKSSSGGIVYGSNLGSNLGSSHVIGGGGSHFGGGLSTTRTITSGGPLISSGNYGLVSPVNIPATSLYLPPLKKK